MKPFLTIDSEARLELSDLNSEDSKKIIFDINADYDGSVKSFATFMETNSIIFMMTSSKVDFSDEYGIDDAMLDSFFDSVRNYEVWQLTVSIIHKDTLVIEGDMREAYFAWLANLEGVSIKEKLDMVDTHLAINIDEVEEIPF